MISPAPLKESIAEGATYLLPTSWQQWMDSLYRQVLGVRASVTWDPGSIASGAQSTQSVTAPGASLGDFVKVSSSASLSNLFATAHVSAANTVIIVLSNLTGAPVDLASSTWKVLVYK